MRSDTGLLPRRGERMIFEETEDGCVIYIPHKQMMNPDTAGFIVTILHGRDMYQRDANAELDDDNSDGE